MRNERSQIANLDLTDTKNLFKRYKLTSSEVNYRKSFANVEFEGAYIVYDQFGFENSFHTAANADKFIETHKHLLTE